MRLWLCPTFNNFYIIVFFFQSWFEGYRVISDSSSTMRILLENEFSFSITFSLVKVFVWGWCLTGCQSFTKLDANKILLFNLFWISMNLCSGANRKRKIFYFIIHYLRSFSIEELNRFEFMRIIKEHFWYCLIYIQ